MRARRDIPPAIYLNTRQVGMCAGCEVAIKGGMAADANAFCNRLACVVASGKGRNAHPLPAAEDGPILALAYKAAPPPGALTHGTTTQGHPNFNSESDPSTHSIGKGRTPGLHGIACHGRGRADCNLYSHGNQSKWGCGALPPGRAETPLAASLIQAGMDHSPPRNIDRASCLPHAAGKRRRSHQ